MSYQLAVWRGAIRAEFRMQIQRRAMWFTFALLTIVALPFRGGLPEILTVAPHTSIVAVLCQWSVLVNFLGMIGVAFFMADRLPRDHIVRVDELFASVADGLAARLVGKYLGGLAAVMVPLTLWYGCGVASLSLHMQDLTVIVLGIVTYCAIVIPGALFVGAFSLACPAVLWVPLYQFLFVGYWLWGNAFPPYPHFPIITLSGTMLTPVGSAISVGLFHVPAFGLYHLSLAEGIASLCLLPGIAIGTVLLLTIFIRWQMTQQ
jgi:ABC-2 type transport system permease protein